MSGTQSRRRAVDAVLLMDKPSGITSHRAVQMIRRLFNAVKAGHTGTLDPLATGLLPVCLGEATKFSHLLLEADKGYLATIRLGMTTRTGDLEGEVTARRETQVRQQEIEAVLEMFKGEMLQTPPMYSAIKQGGQPLYKLARAGQETPRVPRRIVISSLNLVFLEGDELTVRVCCSKGTYVRVLAEDIGRALGCGACLSGLRREAVGGFTLSAGAVTLDHLEGLQQTERDAFLLPADAMVASLPRLDLDAAETRRLIRGQPVERPGAGAAGLARVYGPGESFLGVAEVTCPGRIVPKRLTATGC
ncbi:MAG: tRNA pseudouridine(55) synthase TruB [Betaproteobacteria bacterium]|nr:tRNA pseudouridine(55) synthase TruB [Betaproteobacteria bacterium]